MDIVGFSTDSTRAAAGQHDNVMNEQAVSSNDAVERQEIPPRSADIAPHNNDTTAQSVSRGTSDSSLSLAGGRHVEPVPTDGGTNLQEPQTIDPTAVAETGHDVLTNKDGAGSCLDRAAKSVAVPSRSSPASLEMASVLLAPQTPTQRPARAAATATSAGIARQVQQEVNSLDSGALEMVLRTGSEEAAHDNMDVDMDRPVQRQRTPRRRAEGSSRRRKRSHVAASKVVQSPLENGQNRNSARSLRKQKKQRPVATYATNSDQGSSSSVESLLLVGTTTTRSERRGNGKPHAKHKASAKTKTKLTHAVHDMHCTDGRYCEYCKKVANICVLMHCLACYRVYHAKCFLYAFKPYIDETRPILDQMEHLQLQMPERRGNAFRCASCKAAFLDFYESGGFMWDCDCPTCSQSEKTVLYRRKKLVQMMNDMELAKKRKKEEKDQKKNGTCSASEKTLVSTPSPMESTPCSQSIQRSPITPDDSMQNLQLAMSDTRDGSVDGEKVTKIETVGEPVPSQLSGDDLVHDVQVVRDDKTGGWCFPVQCSRTRSLRNSNMMKTGKCTWTLEQNAFIQCSCCDKLFNISEFVHHTYSTLINDATAPHETSMPFLFVEHRNAVHYTLLEHFQQALTSWIDRQPVENPPTPLCENHTAKQEMFVFTEPPAMTMTTSDIRTDTVLQNCVLRLQALALYKQPQHTMDSTSLEFMAQIVCLSPNYVITMQNGSLVDRVVRSKTTAPGDSFPRKAGWLPFGHEPALAHHITCICCMQSFSFDEFVKHAGIAWSTMEKESHELLYVVERLDASALVPFKTFFSDLEYLTANGEKMILEAFIPPPPCPVEL